MPIAAWDSLEVAKLAVSAMTPLVVVALGVLLNRAARRVEDAQWANRKLIERRLALYDELAGPLNDLYCFFRLIGHFRDIDPPTAIQRKRQADRSFYVNQFLMSEHFASLYHAFINTCFRPWVAVGHNAKLRTSAGWQRSERGDGQEWKTEWNDLFVTDDEDMATKDQLTARYEALMRRFAAECGVDASERASTPPTVDVRHAAPSAPQVG